MEPAQEQPSVPRDARGRPRVAKQPGAGWPLDYEQEFNVAAFGPALGLFFVGYQIFGRTPLPTALLIALLVVTLVPTVPTLIEQWKDIRFRTWVLDHWDEIDEGTAVLNGQRVGRDSLLGSYPLICSAVAIQLRTPGRPVLLGTPTANYARWTSVLVAAVGGWWCLPAGPFVTLSVLRRGIRNQPQTVTLEEVAVATLQNKALGEVDLDA